MKSKFHISMVDDSGPDAVTVYIDGKREFETRAEAEKAMFALRRASEAAGFDTEYKICECLHFES